VHRRRFVGPQLADTALGEDAAIALDVHQRAGEVAGLELIGEQAVDRGFHGG
jgi:hypothetical protein